ncbi:MAG: NRDE family protein [Desulfobacterales bacterium]|nr:NRDE family protein [Desulfobacterales bacterium]
MCLVLFAHDVCSRYPLILAANRDEFHNRPTAPMDFWPGTLAILAGRDLEQGGTWFGLNKNGRFAALTNFRDPFSIQPDAPSRGEIIVDFLNSEQPCQTYFNRNLSKMMQYNGFNLLFGDATGLFWFSNIRKKTGRVRPGIHGLSNKDLNTPWPKVFKGKNRLKQVIDDSVTTAALFNLLSDPVPAKDDNLPDTGVGLQWERLLSAIFIQNHIYGTRSSTLLLRDRSGGTKVIERTYDHPERADHFTDREFDIPG